jgi:ribonuclease D
VNSKAQVATRVRQALQGAEEPILIETDNQLIEAAESWQTGAIFGLDTEFVRERTYRADLGLVQVSDGGSAWLIDPLAIDNLDPLRSFLEDASITKVIHSGSEDFEVMRHQLNTVPTGVVDTQIACAMLGQSLQLGYHHAVKWLFEVEIEKDQTRSNWLKRPLSQGQRRYAALAVVLLPLMIQQLRQELEMLGRWEWLREEVRRMAYKSAQDSLPDQAWMRIGGAGSLDDQERKILLLLATWREETAAGKNLARGFVVSDSGLVAMARQRPAGFSALEALEELHPKAVNRYGSIWIDLIKQADSMPPVPPLPQLSHRHRRIMKAMRTKVLKAANSLNVDAALLASRKQLERLIFEFEETGGIPERMTGWRQEVITNDLVNILKGQ